MHVDHTTAQAHAQPGSLLNRTAHVTSQLVFIQHLDSQSACNTIVDAPKPLPCSQPEATAQSESIVLLIIFSLTATLRLSEAFLTRTMMWFT